MKRYLVAYGLWLAGVLSAVAVAFFYYRRVVAIAGGELDVELANRWGANGDRSSVPPESLPPVNLDRPAAGEVRELPIEEG